ncbi:hypothetical protein [Microbacterium sp. NPDC056569]|uniref:hypothetical protein n=1 Tax=Microbacterium sp. NPDC056569 TaxID=3345867 RepID=UPI00366CABDE
MGEQWPSSGRIIYIHRGPLAESFLHPVQQYETAEAAEPQAWEILEFSPSRYLSPCAYFDQLTLDLASFMSGVRVSECPADIDATVRSTLFGGQDQQAADSRHRPTQAESDSAAAWVISMLSQTASWRVPLSPELLSPRTRALLISISKARDSRRTIRAIHSLKRALNVHTADGKIQEWFESALLAWELADNEAREHIINDMRAHAKALSGLGPIWINPAWSPGLIRLLDTPAGRAAQRKHSAH